MIILQAPEGYKYKDSRSGKTHSEVIINEREKRHFTLVPDTTEPIQKED